MSEYIGLDVSKEETSYCIMEKDGKILEHGKVDSDPDALFEMLKAHTLYPERIVLETGSMSNRSGSVCLNSLNLFYKWTMTFF